MSAIKQMASSWRIIFLVVVIALSIISISPNFNVEGVAIRTVISNSSVSQAGIETPGATIRPMQRERILTMNNRQIEDVAAYHEFVQTLRPNMSVQVKTNRGLYRVVVAADEYGEAADIGFRVYEAPQTNIRKGLDLEGGTRVLLQPEQFVGTSEMEDIILNMEQRLNVFGLSDVTIRDATDLSGNQYIVVEIAGVNEEEVKDLLSQQGKFEAYIGNETVFKGGNDITYVCRTADCSGIDPRAPCQQFSDGWLCRFSFAISLSPSAAQRQANLTANLAVVGDSANQADSYLSEQLVLFLDDSEVDRLNIGASLKGQPVTNVQISGSGFGISQQEAVTNTLTEMKRLQTLLITGSLPVKLNTVKTDNVSPVLGGEFLRNAMIMGLIAILSVGAVIFIRYRSLKVSIPVVVTALSEIVMLLGVAALIGWNIDLAAIAGIIIAVGTGVDHQIVIADETLKGSMSAYSWKEKIKRAFFIITGTYLTIIVAMIPLLFAGAGLLKGFAIITMIGASVGVFISRPAFASIIEILLSKE